MEYAKFFAFLSSNLIFIHMRTYRKYSTEDIVRASAKVKSMAELLRELNLKLGGGTQSYMRKKLVLLNIDCSHWTGQLWSKGKSLKDIEEYARASSAKPHWIKLRGHRCEDCKLEKWKDRPISLEVHHVDGDKKNNVGENIQLLCPNCHSLTPSWRRKKS